jgi:hypothetical protein
VIPAAEAMLAEALFCSDLQPSEQPPFDDICAAVRGSFERFGVDGCVAAVAQEYGDHPAAAQARMAWALDTVTEAFTLSPA